jgi:hypothetical protein
MMCCAARGAFLLLALAGHARARVVISIDVGTESTRAAVFDEAGRQLASHAFPPVRLAPLPGLAEQRPDDWWSGLGTAVRDALMESDLAPDEVGALCIATTSCTVLADAVQAAVVEASAARERPQRHLVMASSGRSAAVEPSVLAADLGNLAGAAREVRPRWCLEGASSALPHPHQPHHPRRWPPPARRGCTSM